MQTEWMGRNCTADQNAGNALILASKNVASSGVFAFVDGLSTAIFDSQPYYMMHNVTASGTQSILFGPDVAVSILSSAS
jgi:hypothetical protein